MKLKIATYNIAAGLYGDYFKKKDYYISADIIKHINADIIGLNEVGKPLPKEIEDHTRFIAQHCGYENYIFGEAAIYRSYPYGNAILSKYPIDKPQVFQIKRHKQLLPGIYEPRCVLTANILCEKPLRIICTHLGLFPDEQKQGILKVCEVVKSEKIPTVFMGDLNTISVSSILAPVRKLLRDACEIRHDSLKTYPAGKPNRKLDYIFVTEDIIVNNVYTVQKVGSDHLPLAAEIEI